MVNSTWQANRNSSAWSGGLVEWTVDKRAYLSVVFSWNLQQAYQRVAWYRSAGYAIFAGGPAVALNPSLFDGVALTSFDSPDAIARHNPSATFTTRGCIRHCQFCAVPRMEGEFRELDDWPIRPIVCDNNLLAASSKHFDSVIDKLKPLQDVDFNQGLDARLLTIDRARKLAELRYKCIRLAWDDTKTERQFMRAFEILQRVGIPASKIHVYVLIGFNDTPGDALYRLETVAGLGAYPNPMRYQPLDSRRRNEYVAPGWTDAELKRYMRYWANLRITRRVPFVEFRHRGDEPRIQRIIGQAELL